MYDLVAGKKLVKKSYLLSKSKALEEFPVLKSDRLCGALVYYDGIKGSHDIYRVSHVLLSIGQQNDARMNISIAMTAAREGAAVSNHVEVTSLIKEKVHPLETANLPGTHDGTKHMTTLFPPGLTACTNTL